MVGIDHIQELVNWSVGNLKADGLEEALENREIVMITGDGRSGFPEEGNGSIYQTFSFIRPDSAFH